MTWKITIRGSADRPIAAEYMCPEHGRFTVTAERDANGDPPGEMHCQSREWECECKHPAAWHLRHPDGMPRCIGQGCRCQTMACGQPSPFVLSAPRVSVRRIEVERGGWEKPARKTFLDTRDLGEGQDVDEWRAKREAIRDQQRRDSLKELIDG